MSEHEFQDEVNREMARLQIALRLNDEKIAEQEVRIARLENRATRQEEKLTLLAARHDELSHKLDALLRLIGLSNEDLQAYQDGTLDIRYLLHTIGRRTN